MAQELAYTGVCQAAVDGGFSESRVSPGCSSSRLPRSQQAGSTLIKVLAGEMGEEREVLLEVKGHGLQTPW